MPPKTYINTSKWGLYCPVGVNIPPEAIDVIDILAAKTHRSRSEVLRALIYTRLADIGVVSISDTIFRL